MKIIGKIFWLIVVVVITFGVTTWRSIADETPSGDPVAIIVESGSTTADVAALLSDNGLLDKANLFRWYGRLTCRSQSIQAGEFQIEPGLGLRAIYEALSRGTRSEQTVTMLEGWSLREFAASLEDDGLVEADAFMLDASAALWSDQYPFLAEIPQGLDLEGYLFPESYRVFEGASSTDIIGRLLAQFNKEIIVERADQIAASEYSLFEIVTIASIIEREVRGLEDMKLVADIIRKRLRDGMPLQMDSTVNYVTGGNSPAVTLKETAIDSPYNTYKYAGLPLGPISNPSANAIDAILNPTPNDYYFFLTTAEGDVKYGVTHAEHVANKNRYLR